jgi:hypothetical protein
LTATVTLAANGTIDLPAKAVISDIIFDNPSGTGVTLTVGTTLGGTDVVTAVELASETIQAVGAAGLGIRAFYNIQTLYIDSGYWGTASAIITIAYTLAG